MQDKIKDINYNIDEKTTEYYTDVFSPGETKQQLRLGKEVRGSVGGGKFKVLKLTRNASLGATDYIVTGVGFKPKLVKILASSPANSYVSYSDGVGSEDTIDGGYCKFVIYSSNNINDSNTNSRIIRVQLSATSEQIAKLKSLDSDGFTLTFTTSTGTDNITMQIECYG